MGRGKSYKCDLIGILLMSAFCVVIYSNTLDSPFVFDDYPNISNNPYIRLTRLEFSRLYDAAFKSTMPTRPVANVSFALNYYLGKYSPRGYHIVNIIIHLVNGIMVYFLALIILKQPFNVSKQALPSKTPESSGYSIRLVSLFTALIFIVHPIQAQSVTYIVQRMNSMATMFYLLSLLLYIHARLVQIRWKRWTLFSACLLSAVMALGSKEIAATLPILIWLCEWYFFQDLSMTWFKKKSLYVLVPLVILLLLAFIYLGEHPLERIAARYTSRDFTMGERVLTQFRVVVFYISLLLFPHPSRISLIHEVTTSHGLFDPMTTFLSLLLIIVLIGLGVYLARSQRVISFCIFWFFINLIMESSIIGLEMVFEHRLYLPMFSFALVLVYLLFRHLSNKHLWAIAISAMLIVPLATTTYLRNEVWQDKIRLWSDVVSKYPKSPRGHNNLGKALHEISFDEAVTHYYEALRLKPDFAHAHSNLGLALKERGKLDEAISHCLRALELNPKHVSAHVNLAAVLLRQGHLEESIMHSLEALRLRPDHVGAYNNLGNALVRKRRFDEAIKVFAQALQIEPDDVKAHSNLGVVFMEQGRLDEAISHFSEALRIKRDNAKVHSNLGVALFRQKRFSEAINHFSQALQIKPDYEEARRNLEAARRLMGKSPAESHPGVKR